MCENNFAFRSLNSCRQTCAFMLGKREKPPLEESQLKRFEYKIVTKRPDELHISSNGELTMLDTLNRVKPSDYFVHENNVKVCYPLDPTFYYCNKYQIDSTQTRYTDTTNHSILADNRLHGVGSFFLHGEHTVLCNVTEQMSTLEIVHLVACLLSAICLLFTLLVALKIQKLKLAMNLGLVNHVITLFAGYVLLSVKLIANMTSPYFCLVVPLLQQFSFLSAFFWLNVQSLYLYRTLKCCQNGGLRVKRCHVFLDFIYACGVPGVITVATCLAEVLEIDVVYPFFRQNCWFLLSDRKTSFLFYYGPMAWTLVVNIAIFVAIVCNLRRVGKQLEIVNAKIHKQLFILCLKLMVVMCFCWFIKIAFWGVGILQSVWSYMDIVTYFQGVFVFLVYACKWRVMQEICSLIKLKKPRVTVVYKL